MNSLNPVFTVGNQLVETLLRHEDMTRRDAWDKSVDMLKAVGIPSPRSGCTTIRFRCRAVCASA